MKWEGIDKNTGSRMYHLWRSKLPTGWLVRDESGSICFIKDPNHKWVVEHEMEAKAEAETMQKPSLKTVPMETPQMPPTRVRVSWSRIRPPSDDPELRAIAASLVKKVA